MSQEESGRQGTSEVCIGFPAHGSDPPPQPPRTVAENDDLKTCFGCCCFSILGIPFLVAVVISIIRHWGNEIDPSFKVESISVSLQHNNNNVSSDDPQLVTWNIGFSVENENRQASLHFRKFHIRVRSMSWSSEVAILPPLKQPHRNTTFLNATLYASLSPEGVSRLVQGLGFDVIFRAKYKCLGVGCTDVITEVACKNMTVGFSSNANAIEGVMVGGPTPCSFPSSVKPDDAFD